MESLFYGLLAILGLGFLVFIHELGHFLAARREGMRVEAFSIGFGKPLYTWKWKGVQWMICLLPFGGYVRIAGMQREGIREPYEVPDGFYGKRPWQRIKVALAGPLVNILFAIVVFCVLWIAGGRDKQFAEFTNRIGWVDPESPLYKKGVRPGDVIQKYDGRPFHGFKDLLVASLMDDKTARIEGYKLDQISGERKEFDYTLGTYANPQFSKDKLFTIGIFSPASYLIFDDRGEHLFEQSPLVSSGIQLNDRIVWADGEPVFSIQQLSALTNESSAFLTIQRGDQLFHTKMPRVRLDDLKMSLSEKAEVGDWQYEAGLKGRLQDLYFLPFNFSPNCVVESEVSFIDAEEQSRILQACQRSPHFIALQEGDRLLAVDGMPVYSSYQLLKQLQTRHVLLIVDRDSVAVQKALWSEANAQFDHYDRADFRALIDSIGTQNPLKSRGSLVLLDPIVPKSKSELPLSPVRQAAFEREMAVKQQEIEAIRDPAQRSEALKQFEQAKKRLVLGLSLRDREVVYNPNPMQQFKTGLSDTWRTLTGFFSGGLNPKYMSGPVGIVHVVHQSWMVGVKEALFWMAVISLNLGIVNLLPIPVLDGGHIVFAALEMIRRRPLRSKTMERLLIPFIGMLIAFFIYITYQDIARLFSKFF